MLEIIRPILFSFLGSVHVKRLIVKVLSKIAQATDNTLDDKAVEFIKNGLFPEEAQKQLPPSES